MPTFRQAIRLPVPAATAFAYHERPGAFERLAPPWQYCRVLRKQGGIKPGAVVVLEVGVLGPIHRKWTLEHRDYQPNRQFTDVQIQGPFKRWSHAHLSTADAANNQYSTLSDFIDYELPLGAVGRILFGASVERFLKQLFAYRHRVTLDDLTLHAKFSEKPEMRIAITGSTGLVGSALTALLTTAGHNVIPLVRRTPNNENEVQWNPDGLITDDQQARLEGMDAVIHLAGENIAAARWTDAQMKRIRNSRIQGTRNLVLTLTKLQQPPSIFIGASAVGFYGSRRDEILKEDAPVGTGFLAELCRDWENETTPLRAKGIRVVNARLGVVLSPQGGALKKMLLPFKLGMGGNLGHGRQWFPWIALDDVISALYFILMNDEANGIVNLVSPQAVTNAEFTKTLGRVLRRPTIVPMPALLAKLAFSKRLAEQLLLASTRVQPKRLEELDYEFRHPELEDALRHQLGRIIHNAP